MAQSPYDEEFKSADELQKRFLTYAGTADENVTRAERGEEQITAPTAKGVNYDPQFQKILGQEEQQVQEAKAANEQAQAHAAAAAAAKAPYIKGAQDEIQKQLDNPIEPPTAPQFGPVPNQGQYIDQTAAKAMFAVASMMAALGMAGGRGRGMLAMAGMTGALAGFNEGNYEKYKEGMDQYKTQVEEQIASYNMQMKDYQARIDQRGITLEQRKNLLELEAIKHNDVMAQDILKQQGAEGLFKYYDDMRKTVDGMAKAANQDLLGPMKVKMAEMGLQRSELELQKIQLEMAKIKAGGTTGTSASQERQAANELLTRLQAEVKQLDKDIPASRSWFQDTPETQTLMNRKADLQRRIEGALKTLEELSTPQTPQSPKAGGTTKHYTYDAQGNLVAQ